MDSSNYHVPEALHADKRRPVIVHADTLPWTPSPMVGVERRFLERVGKEVARATSIVRYAPNSRFSSHRHDEGEEYLVLDGVFSDNDGDFAQGSYVRNPPGSEHSPFTREGCTIFVKLRQMSAAESQTVQLQINTVPASPIPVEGLTRQSLGDYPDRERVGIETLAAGTRWMDRQSEGGEELLVLEGSIRYGEHTCGPLTWIRTPQGLEPPIEADRPARYWVKRGHLPPARAD